LGLLLLLTVSSAAIQAAENLPPMLQSLPQALGKLSYYHPQKKEGRFSIARRNGISLRSLSLANPRREQSGELLLPKLFFPPPGEPNSLLLNLAERMLYLYDEKGRPCAAYPAAIGQVGWETPTGSFKIHQKRKNPTWFPPSWAKLEKPVPPGPENPLGDRWMGLSVPGYGLHATNSPASVGRAASHGCIRLYPEHAHDIYSRVSKGTRVKIIYETLLLGYSPANHAIYLAVHPDIYRNGTNTPARAKARLRQAGLEGFVDETELLHLLKSPRGVPIALLGSEYSLQVNRLSVALPLGPTLRGRDFLVPAAPLAAALGAGLSVEPLSNSFRMQREKKWFAFSPNNATAQGNGSIMRLAALPFQLVGCKTPAAAMPMVPVKAAGEALGASVWVDRRNRVIHITDKDYFARQQAFPNRLSYGQCHTPYDYPTINFIPFMQ
jgi:L,D-transpeptidase ErfK/SrfK